MFCFAFDTIEHQIGQKYSKRQFRNANSVHHAALIKTPSTSSHLTFKSIYGNIRGRRRRRRISGFRFSATFSESILVTNTFCYVVTGINKIEYIKPCLSN